MAQFHNNNIDIDWPKAAKRDQVFTFRINRNIVWTLLISILLHLSLLWIFAPKLFSIGAPVENAPPLEISLGPPQKEEVAPSEAVLPKPEPVEEVLPKQQKPKPVKTRPPKQVKPIETPVEIVQDSETKITKNEKLNKAIPKPAPIEMSADPLPGEDMQAYIKRQQQAKLAKEGLSTQDVEAVMASNNPQSAGDKRDAKIKENLDLEGKNGIFEIRYLGPHHATFSFKGWKNNVNTARLEIFNVDATDGNDIKLAVIRKMIEIIRRDYDGDFNWESRRLGRVIELSARLPDNAQLEAFLMKEFFGPGSSFQ
ncbi:MAG: hypothetical protein ACSHWN_03810 [Methylophilaceae bacterium]